MRRRLLLVVLGVVAVGLAVVLLLSGGADDGGAERTGPPAPVSGSCPEGRADSDPITPGCQTLEELSRRAGPD